MCPTMLKVAPPPREGRTRERFLHGKGFRNAGNLRNYRCTCRLNLPPSPAAAAVYRFPAANSQFTSSQKCSRYFGRALR